MIENAFPEQERADNLKSYRQRENQKYLNRVEELRKNSRVHPLSRYIGLTFANKPGRRSKSPPVKTVVAVEFRDYWGKQSAQAMVGYRVPESDEVLWMLAANFKGWLRGAVRVKIEGGSGCGG